MANANINIRVDSDVKAQAQALFADFGLDLSTAVNLFLRQAIREQGFTFDLHHHNASAAIMDAIDDVKAGRVHGPFATVEEAVASMLEDDDDV
jgi:DNA-damage-inducible protein J